MINPLAKKICDDLIVCDLEIFVTDINRRIEQQLSEQNHGDFKRWFSALDNAPDLKDITLDTTQNAVTISSSGDASAIKETLQKLIPWRKGPYQIANVEVDCEWRSDFKWDRIKSHINLHEKRVLDIGCGNGYHCWRMLEQKPKWVLGIDPNLLFNLQFRFVNHYAKRDDIDVIPLGIEHLPQNMALFDTVFSMGVLYHRKSPIDHLYELKSLLAKDGELILETLVIEGDEQAVLVPEGRYAKMRNVWFIPSVAALTKWLKKVGFKNVIVLDVSVTSLDEQRSTDWMVFESLKDYLDENDTSKTVEGHPAPKRVVIRAKLA
jgi:tRNA (mo5U34)-methyltransferase